MFNDLMYFAVGMWVILFITAVIILAKTRS